MEQPTDNEIVQRVAAGDTEAFGIVVRRYSEPIFRLVAGMLGDRERAEEVTQECFIRAYEHLDRFRGGIALSTWLYRIAYNRAVDASRRRRFLRLGPEHARISTEDDAPRYGEEETAAVRRALDRLAPADRALIALYYEEERPVAEVAEITGLSVANVKVKLHRTRALLRKYMEKE